MLRGRREVRVMPFPGIVAEMLKPGEVPPDVGVRLLDEDQTDECRVRAVEHVQLKAKAIGLGAAQLLQIDPEFLDKEISRQIIAVAFVEAVAAEDGKRGNIFPSPRAVRQLDPVIVETLSALYDDQHHYLDPLRTASEEELKELVDSLGKGPRLEAILLQYDVRTLRSLLHTTVAELATLLSGKSDSGPTADQT